MSAYVAPVEILRRELDTLRLLSETYRVDARLERNRDELHVCAWTPYMGGPTVYLTATDAARLLR